MLVILEHGEDHYNVGRNIRGKPRPFEGASA
jgi:hypothetical protein